MQRLLTILVLLSICWNSANSQPVPVDDDKSSYKQPDEGEVVTFNPVLSADKWFNEMLIYVSSNLQLYLPKKESLTNVRGAIVCSFNVNKSSGVIEELKIVRGLAPWLNHAILNAMISVPPLNQSVAVELMKREKREIVFHFGSPKDKMGTDIYNWQNTQKDKLQADIKDLQQQNKEQLQAANKKWGNYRDDNLMKGALTQKHVDLNWGGSFQRPDKVAISPDDLKKESEPKTKVYISID